MARAEGADPPRPPPPYYDQPDRKISVFFFDDNKYGKKMRNVKMSTFKSFR